jgi:signal transduction histidine kinase
MYKTVIRNLLSNAVKFTNPGGKIQIFSQIDQGMAVITVSDNGIGINEDDIPKLWDITTSYSRPGTSNEKGTGIGLTLCKEFVEKHGGRIWVESVPGKGSDFRFSLPVSVQ